MAKVKEKLDKCVKEKLMDFCDVLNIPINKAVIKKEVLSVKLLEFLECPHATTYILLADKEQKGKKRKVTPSKNISQSEASDVQAKTDLAAYKEGRAPGAGVAFVMFKDVYTANKAAQDFRNEKKRQFGKFFSVMELRLQRNQWKVERAPLATDIYWNHLESTKLSLD